MVAVACAKEETVKENVVEGKASGNVTLTASMPEFTNADTKAAVSDAGVFSWTAGDIIDVVYEKSGSADKTYQFECTNASTGEFTNVDAIDDGYTLKTDGSIAFYPHEYNGTPSSQTFDSPALAAKGFQMHATYSAGNLAFVHDNAMMKVTVTNVPSFAKQLEVGTSSVSLSYDSNQASVSYYVPVVAAASAQLGIAIKDNSSNNIIAKTSHNSVAITAGHFYSLPSLAIGPVVLIKNATDWGDLDVVFSDATLGAVPVHAITIGGFQHYYAVSTSLSLDQTSAILIKKSGESFPAMYDKSITLSSQETIYVADKTDGIRLSGDSTKRIHVEILEGAQKASMYDTFIHIWGTSDDNTTWGSDSEESRCILAADDDEVSLGAKAKGYVNNGNAAGKNLMVYIDLSASTGTFSIRLHNSSNEGGELTSQTATPTSRYAYYDRVLRRYTYQMDAWDNIYGVSNPDPYSCPDSGYEVWLYNNAGYWTDVEKLHLYGTPSNWKAYDKNTVDSVEKTVGGKNYKTWYIDKGTETGTQTIMFYNDDTNQDKEASRPTVNFGSDWEKGIIDLN